MRQQSLEKVGIKIGHYTDLKNLTGVTVFIAEKGTEIGIDIRGSSTASYNTEAYGSPKAATRLAQAVVLSGGSSYGLESIFGVMSYLEEHNIGKKVGKNIVPGITGGAIFDLQLNNRVRPTKKNGYEAAKNASYIPSKQGNIGVGIGATVGKWIYGKLMKGGFGMEEITLSSDIIICAFVVTNSVGDIINPTTGKFYIDEGNYHLEKRIPYQDLTQFGKLNNQSSFNTTLAVVATNVVMNRDQLLKVAEIGQDGMARAIFPVHSMHDGDIVFALSSYSGERRKIRTLDDTALTDIVALGAADCLGKAIKSSIIHAKAILRVPAYKE